MMITLFTLTPAPGWEIRSITILFFLFVGVVALTWIVRRASAQYYKEDADMDALRSFVGMTPKQQEQVKTEIGIHAYLELVAKEQQARRVTETGKTYRIIPEGIIDPVSGTEEWTVENLKTQKT